MEGRDVRGAAVDSEVAVGHELARVVAGRRDAEPEDHVIEPQLEDAEQVLARHAGAGLSVLEVVVELALQDAVDAADLLLLAQLEAVVADLAAADAVLAGRRGPPLERALLGIAARTLEEELGAFATAEPADRTGVSSHDASPGYTRRRFGGRQPLCGMGVTSVIAVTSRPAVWSERIACSRPAPGPFT